MKSSREIKIATQCVWLSQKLLKPSRMHQPLMAAAIHHSFYHQSPHSLFYASSKIKPRNTAHSFHTHTWSSRLLYTAGGITCAVCAWVGFQFMPTTAVACKSTSSTASSAQLTRSGDHIQKKSSSLPSLTLYQYQTCPFCCKTRAFLDYYEIPYNVVEVNPLFRSEIKFSKYRKVPFIVCGNVQVNDSSLLISVLRTCMLNEGQLSVAKAMDLYPEMSYTDDKGKNQTERANKYFIMLGEDGPTKGVSLAERREEREWREWVDDKLVHVLPPNIYRTPSEALQAFDYISQVGNFNFFERVAAKYLGAFSMYFIGKMLKKKYQLDDDVRSSLYRYCQQWCAAVGKDREFMGGSRPNLADLAVYGVLNSIEGYSTFNDMLIHTPIGPWYFATQNLVQKHKANNAKANPS